MTFAARKKLIPLINLDDAGSESMREELTVWSNNALPDVLVSNSLVPALAIFPVFVCCVCGVVCGVLPMYGWLPTMVCVVFLLVLDQFRHYDCYWNVQV